MSAMKSALSLFAVGFLFLIVAACGGPTQSTGNVANCSFPATTASTPATGDCNANRTLIQCKTTDAYTETCLSDNVNACPGEDPNGTCVNQCQPDEYAAGCGGPPPADGGGQPNDSPPSTACHPIGGFPNGTALYCCPCGS
jgi:hypothetical protein